MIWGYPYLGKPHLLSPDSRYWCPPGPVASTSLLAQSSVLLSSNLGGDGRGIILWYVISIQLCIRIYTCIYIYTQRDFWRDRRVFNQGLRIIWSEFPPPATLVILHRSRWQVLRQFRGNLAEAENPEPGDLSWCHGKWWRLPYRWYMESPDFNGKPDFYNVNYND